MRDSGHEGERHDDWLAAPQRLTTRMANIEGYLALGFMVAYFAMPLVYSVDHPSEIDQAIGFTLWTFWLLFAVSGARRAEGRARVAARVALVAFAVLALFIVILSILRFLSTGR
jgi:hypothetical protein